MAKVLKINRKELQKRLEINGLNVKLSAISLMESELFNAFPSYPSVDHFVHQFLQILVTNHKLDSFLIDSQIAEQVIEEMREKRITRTADNQLIVKNVINSSNTSKSYLQHLIQLSKHLKKHPVFQSKSFKLTKIDSLITSTELSIDCIVFGFLMKDSSKINDFLIEDNSGRVPLEFTEETQFRDSLIVENSFVLIEGTYNSSKDCLRVEGIGHSPPIDLNSIIEMSNSIERSGRMIVIISDIHLDDSKTLDKLQTLLTGYDSMVPPIPDSFIFVGDFLSKPTTDVSYFKGIKLFILYAFLIIIVILINFSAHMKNLVKIISRYKKISEFSQLIFVPGFHDIETKTLPV